MVFVLTVRLNVNVYHFGYTTFLPRTKNTIKELRPYKVVKLFVFIARIVVLKLSYMQRNFTRAKRGKKKIVAIAAPLFISFFMVINTYLIYKSNR